ncbi:MAG: hypothetical protein AAF583_01680 [Pseudomonadota bacterium]
MQSFGPWFAAVIAEYEEKNGEIVTEAYLDSGGVWTGPNGLITNPDGSLVEQGQTWSEPEAIAIYNEARSDWAVWLHRLIGRVIPQHQFDGLGILAWNIGREALATSTAFRLFRAGRYEDAAESFLLWQYDTLRGGTTGPDGGPARGPDNKIMPEGVSWAKAFRGIRRRSTAAALVFSGLDWRDAASPQAIQLQKTTEQRPDGSGWKDRVDYATPWSEVLENARGNRLPPLIPEPVEEIALPEPVIGTALPSPNTLPVEDVPYKIDPNAGTKPMEESRRFEGAREEANGDDWIDFSGKGQFATVLAGVMTYLTTHTVPVLLAGISVTLLLFLAIGFWKKRRGRRIRAEGEVNATQALR